MEESSEPTQLDMAKLCTKLEQLENHTDSPEMVAGDENVLRRRRGVTFSETVSSSDAPESVEGKDEDCHQKRSKSRTPSFTSAELERIMTDVKARAEEMMESAGAFVGKANEFACNYWNEASEQAGDIARYMKEGAEAAGELAGDVVASTKEHAKELVSKVIETSEQTVETVVETAKFVWEQWKVCDFKSLPGWLQDNDYLHLGHRPPLPSFKECFRSIFRIHTETGNIWTHLIGCLMFVAVTTYFWIRTDIGFDTKEKIVFTVFFIGAIGCLGLSFMFHTVSCHSEFVGKLFSKLDYFGITLLIIGSFVPWLYYGFYCEYLSYIIYLSVLVTLGIASMIVSLLDKFSEPEYRSIRAAVFICFGCTGVVPAVHHAVSQGWLNSVYQASLGWIILTGVLYIFGAVLYALRIPERFFPGKCDIWFHSHQIFHVLVICAAFVHYHGISEMAVYRLSVGECTTDIEVET